jgi:helicase
MQGRAGRPDYHDLGVVVVMAEPDKRLGQGESEEQVAFRLLRGEMGPISLQEDEDSGLEQVLASTAILDDIQKLKNVESLRLGGGNVDQMLQKLHDMDYVNISNQKIHITDLGRIMTGHFLNHEQVSIMKEGVISGVEPEDIIIKLEVFDRAFFVGADRIAATLNVRLPSRVFQGAAMEMALSGESLGKLDNNTKQKLMNFATDFLTCNCKDTPYCGCPERKFSKGLLQMRCDGASPAEIIETMTARYGVFAYLGDVIEYLEAAARHLEAIVKIAGVTKDQQVKGQAQDLLKCIIG